MLSAGRENRIRPWAAWYSRRCLWPPHPPSLRLPPKPDAPKQFSRPPSPTLGRQSARLAGPGAQPRRRDEVAVTTVKNVTIGLRCKDIEAEHLTPRDTQTPHSTLKATMPRGPKGASRGGRGSTRRNSRGRTEYRGGGRPGRAPPGTGRRRRRALRGRR